MSVRAPCALSFYREASPRVIESYLKDFSPPSLSGPALGGVVPHAGWAYSGKTAAKVFYTIKNSGSMPETFVLFGAVHRSAAEVSVVDGNEAWATPLGEVAVDLKLAEMLLQEVQGLIQDSYLHRGEHSIEVEVPFIRYFFPQSKILPILSPPTEKSHRVGASIGRELKRLLDQGRSYVVVASTDLTHYGMGYGFAPAGSRAKEALSFMEKNDSRIIRLIEALKAEEVVQEARRSMNACGSGAVASALAAAREMGARRGVLVEYTTSYHAYREDPVTHCVGYLGAVFEP